MRHQTTLLLLVASLLLMQYGECAASDACLDGIKCFATGLTFSIFENPQCTGVAIGNAAVFKCPAASPNCYGGLVGVSPASANVPGTGPCLPAPPPCTAPGNFSIKNAAGARVCRAYYECTLGVAEAATKVCPAAGQEFNAATRVCEAAATANCSIPLRPPACTTRGKFADATSCRHYYRCGFFGRRSRVRCPFNLRFSTDTNSCRRNANCATRPLN